MLYEYHKLTSVMTRDLELAGHDLCLALYIRHPWIRKANQKQLPNSKIMTGKFATRDRLLIIAETQLKSS